MKYSYCILLSCQKLPDSLWYLNCFSFCSSRNLKKENLYWYQSFWLYKKKEVKNNNHLKKHFPLTETFWLITKPHGRELATAKWRTGLRAVASSMAGHALSGPAWPLRPQRQWCHALSWLCLLPLVTTQPSTKYNWSNVRLCHAGINTNDFKDFIW